MKFFAFAALILAAFQAGVWAATAPEEPPTCGVSLLVRVGLLPVG